MQLPVKAHYATLAMLSLAEKAELGEPLPARVIAREQNIPMQFLGQILQQLRAAGLIHSTRGANGGFLIEGTPTSITVREIVEAVCPLAASAQSVDQAAPYAEAVAEVWEQLQAKQREFLSAVTLGDLMQRASVSSPMFYI